MNNVTFTLEEKASMFDEISAWYYNQNFGKATKSDMELLMFKFYLEALIKKNQFPNGTIDYKKCSDYQISKDLCITQQQVKNLKIRKQLKYPEEFVWQESLAKLLPAARLDDKKIIIGIPDPNLYLEIENFMEERGFYVEKTLNSKLLKMRIEYFIELSIEAEGSENRRKIVHQIKENIKAHQKDEKIFDEKNIGRTLIESGANLTTILANVTSMLSGTSLLGGVINLVENFRK